jgi:type VI secretion system protein VasJ
LARICLESSQPQLAAPLLEELEGYIQKHQLEQWEPRLCLAAYTALLNARRLLLNDSRRATPELAEKTNQLHERIARLDLATALSLDAQ